MNKPSRGNWLLALTAVSFFAAAVGLSAAPGREPQEAAAAASDNAALVWDEAVLHGIRATKPGPTIVARALAVVHTAMFDAWTAYDDVAVPTVPRTDWRRPPAERNASNKAEAVSYAGYRAVSDLFPSEVAWYDATFQQQGYAPGDHTTDLATARGVGNSAAAAVLAIRHHDGSNQLGDLAPGAYADYTGYVPVNTSFTVDDPNRWQPLAIVVNGTVVTQSFTTPQWSLVTPFALTSGSALRPAGPPLWPDPRYKEEADSILALSAALTDRQKMLAEYFADGPNSEFPPGHWALFAQFVSRRDGHTLDQDVPIFFALGNGLLDASISAWDAKRFYDYVRPMTAIRFLYRGQTIQAWGGPGAGTVTILGEQWRPYQLPNVVTPPFPEFFSGHSVFSATGAQILATATGSDAFGYSVTLPAGSSVAEPGAVPAADVVLSWATFSDAANDAGMSRRYGGIHFPSGDLAGRAVGRAVGAFAWQKAQTYVDGTAYRVEVEKPPRSRVTRVVGRPAA
ncbi:MAG: vanadium-dependent haloperoxidase [Acidobacteriota bacterium]